MTSALMGAGHTYMWSNSNKLKEEIMKRKLAMILILALACILTGCAKTSQNSLKTEMYILPNSYLVFNGMEPDEAAKSCMELGEEFCTDVKVVSEGIQLELTEEQLNNLIMKNNRFIDELAEKFTSSNSMYRYETDETYQKLTLYFDENISGMLQIKTIMGIASSYAMNYMLLNNTKEWQVEIEIYNCHTNKLVASVKIPGEEMTYGAKEWEESYKE